MRTSFVSTLCVLAVACGGSAPTTAPTLRTQPTPPVSSTMAAPAASAPAFPVALVTLPGTGVALYGGADSSGSPIGYVSSDVEVQVLGPPEGDRVPVRIDGAMRVSAYLSLSRLGARVQRRGRIRGTPVYVGANDVVHVLGFEPDGRVRVEATPVTNDSTVAGTYVGTYPAAGLGAARIEASDDTAAPGSPARLPARVAITLYDAPNGNAITTLPAGDIGLPCLVAREENGFRAVLVGTGPYLAGYITETPTPGAAIVQSRARAPFPGGVPRRLREDAAMPLVRLSIGTRVTFDGRTIAELAAPGYARAMQQHDATQEADVFVAVDDDLAIRGIVPLSAVSAAAPP